jgi:hypothetical protein
MSTKVSCMPAQTRVAVQNQLRSGQSYALFATKTNRNTSVAHATYHSKLLRLCYLIIAFPNKVKLWSTMFENP